jgi:hypothetical protein
MLLVEGAKPLPWRTANGKERGKLEFRRAKIEEAPELKTLYEEAWGCGIRITEGQLISKMAHFPEGQIVGCEPESGKPVSMINIMLSEFDPRSGFRGGYEDVTGGRTFSTHIPPRKLVDNAGSGRLPVALCVSIAVAREHAKNGFAIETLNYAIEFAEENGLYAVPYSAPRGYGAALGQCPSLDLISYLHHTYPTGSPYEKNIERIERLNRTPRVARAFRLPSGIGSIRQLSRELYDLCQGWGPDASDARLGQTAFSRFLSEYGEEFRLIYGRYALIEDFCLVSGRKPRDPTMRMHVENGARFVRDADGNLSGIFGDSRREDYAAAGYNMLLTYGYHSLLGQPYAD